MADEYIDVLNEEGKTTGKRVLKSVAHAQGLGHRAAHVRIVNSQGELLIQKRAANKESHPNTWDISAAGHVEAGESALTTAIRETQEELDLNLIRN